MLILYSGFLSIFKAKDYLVFVWVEMDMNEMRKLIVIVGIALVLSGCNRDMSRVKNQPFALDATFTNEQIFDNRKMCASVKWESFVDEKNRTIIEVRCQFKDFKKYLEDYYARSYADIIDIPRQEYETEIIYKKRDVESDRAKLEERPEYNSESINQMIIRSRQERLAQSQKALNDMLAQGPPDPLKSYMTKYRIQSLNEKRDRWPVDAYDIYQWAFSNEKAELISYTFYKVFSDKHEETDRLYKVNAALALAAFDANSYFKYEEKLSLLKMRSFLNRD